MTEIPRKAVDVGFRRLVHPYITRGEARSDREVAHERALKFAEKVNGDVVGVMAIAKQGKQFDELKNFTYLTELPIFKTES